MKKLIVLMLSVTFLTAAAPYFIYVDNESGSTGQPSIIKYEYTANAFVFKYIEGHGYVMFVLPRANQVHNYHYINITEIIQPWVVPTPIYYNVMEFIPYWVAQIPTYYNIMEFIPQWAAPTPIYYVTEIAPTWIVPTPIYYYVIEFAPLWAVPTPTYYYVYEFAPLAALPVPFYSFDYIIEFAPPGTVPALTYYYVSEEFSYAHPWDVPAFENDIRYVVIFTTICNLPTLISDYEKIEFSDLGDAILSVSRFHETNLYFIPAGIYYVRIALFCECCFFE